MNKFYLFLWLRWTLRMSLASVSSALFLAGVLTLVIYFQQGLPEFNEKILSALYDIALFWFPLIWSLTLLLSLFRSLKYIFNLCINHYKLELLTCKLDSVIDEIGYGDLVKVWRRWFMVLIWLVAGHMVFALAFTYSLSDYEGVFDWFNIYWLFGFILSSGYFSFVLLANRCKRVRLVKC